MEAQPFSERYGYAPKREPAKDDEIPTWLRVEVTRNLINPILRRMRGYIAPRVTPSVSRTLPPGSTFLRLFYDRLRPVGWRIYGSDPPGLDRNRDSICQDTIPDILARCHWWGFYDFCESAFSLLESEISVSSAKDFRKTTNDLFGREPLQWVFSAEGRIERTHPPEFTEIVEEVRALLEDPKFAGPSGEFRKANQYLSLRPDPDLVNSAKDAVGALEAMAKIISGDSNHDLGYQMGNYFKDKIPPTLREAIIKIYAYRGATPGMAHGQVDLSLVDFKE